MNLDKGDTRLIIETCKKHGLLRNQAAYVLATAKWETAHTMKPIRERGGERYLRSKKYYPYVGMGYVQLTWKANYQRASNELGVDFVKNPKLLLEPSYAAEILVIGSKEGWFTGKKLSDYMTLQRSRFTEARRIINRMDKAGEIALIARQFNKALLAEGYGVEKSQELPSDIIAPKPPQKPAQRDPAQPAPIDQTPTPGESPARSGGFLGIIKWFLGGLHQNRR